MELDFGESQKLNFEASEVELDFGGEELEAEETPFKVPKIEKDYRLGWEKEWDKALTPMRTIALENTRIDPLGGGISSLPNLFSREFSKEALSFIPFAKYFMPENIRELADMEDEEKLKAIGWEAIGAGLWAGGALIAKYGGKAVGKLVDFVKKRGGLELKPIEDALTKLSNKGVWTLFNYEDEAAKLIRGQGFAHDEAAVIARVAESGNVLELKSVSWEKGEKLSKAWKKRIGRLGEKIKTRRMTVADPGGASIAEIERRGVKKGFGKIRGPQRRQLNAAIDDEFYLRKSLDLDDDLKILLEPSNVRANYAKNLYVENLKSAGQGANANFAESMLKEQVRKLYGEEAIKNFNLGHLSDTELSNYLASMFEPKGQKVIESLHRLALGEWKFPWFRPERYVYGMGEAIFNTKSKLFDKVVRAQQNANKYSIDKMNTLMAMLQQKGFGVIEKKAVGWVFKPNKALWNDEVLTETKALLQRIDNLASQGKRGKVLTRQQANEAIERTLRKAKADSPVVFELADIAKSYTDILYKDMLQLYVPKLLDNIPLTKAGRAHIEKLNYLWGTKADQLFSTASGANSVEKVKFIKKMLKEYRSVIKNPDNHFAKKVTKEAEEALRKLAYGSKLPGGMPAYLEGYLPRVAQRGTSFAGYAKQALVGESPFMKKRSPEVSRELAPFQEIFEARTRSQGKQLFFYDEATEAINHAKTLPQAWREHFDFTLSRMLGQPSKWDFRLADALAKLPGIGPMDEYRAMRMARTITGMQYTGMLGIRPFAVFRNLTQPVIMTGAELGGGIRDSASTIKGLFLAGTKKHREYIKSIGAITEFVPEQQMRPLLPKTGFAQSYDNLKDAFMYFFRQSDRLNRYWSGGAAVDKWEWAIEQTVNGARNVKAFSRKVGLRHRPAWERAEIEGLLDLGRFEEAKKFYIKGVIADTQYLYSSADAPRAMGSGGLPRTVMSFNSWWMNYGTALSKWATTGQGTDKIKRLGTWLVSSAAMEQVLESWAGRGTALRSTFIGPFPLGDFGMPPALVPLQQIALASKNAVQGYAFNDAKARKKAVRAFKKSLWAAENFVPGGLLMQQAIRGYEKDEWPGLMMGIVQKNPEKFEPLFGVME